ncbi:MAG: recombinase family protein, partial [Rhizobiaceae bacterium]
MTSEEDCSLSRVAKRLGTNLYEISRILPLAFLAPKITKAILNGTQPVELNAHRLSRLTDLPVT